MHASRPATTHGFSIVELMVAMLIGLIGMIIIFQVFEVSEGIKRTTTGGGDAQQNGVIALYAMGRDLRSAGMGFNDTAFAGCNIVGYDAKRTPPDIAVGAMKLVPVLVTPGATAATPDQVTILYSSASQVSSATTMQANMAAADTQISIMNPYGYNPGDLIVLLEPSVVPPKNCSLLEVTGPLPMTTPLQRQDAGVQYKLVSNRDVTARFNKPGGMAIAYTGGNATRVYNLGNLYEPQSAPNVPVYNTYAISNDPAKPNYNALTVSSPFVLDAAGVPVVNPVADNIVHMRVQYGIDDGVDNGTVKFSGVFAPGDGLVDRFTSVAPAAWDKVIAVRVALVARSMQAEKPGGTTTWPNCDTTTDGTEPASPALPDNRPSWAGGVFDVSASGDPSPTSQFSWRCYRYRVFETTIPLRNWIWKSS
jgi:type IV pilus assembly protein PilW